MKNTLSQQLAIEQRNASLIVSAAAGSGKTSVMIQRVVDCICKEKVSVDELLVVTFTRAAAQEMLERIRRELTKEADKACAEDAAFLSRQLQLLDGASVSTIHTFCGSLLKRYYPLLNLDPDYTIPAEAEMSALFDSCYRDVLEEVMAEKDPRIMEVFRLYWDTTKDNVKDMLQRILTFCRSRAEGLQWLERQIAQLREGAKAPFQSFWAEEMCRYLEILYGQTLLQNAAALEAGYAAFCNGDMKKAVKKTAKNPEGERAYVAWLAGTSRRVAELLHNGDLGGVAQALAGEPKDVFYKAQNNPIGDEYKTIKSILKVELKEKVGGYDEAEESRAMTDIADRLEGFFLLASRVEEAFIRRKERSGKLQFDDLERLTLRLLDMPEVCADIQGTYKYVFVDEYQDVNQVQESIISRVSRPDNLFCVGDLKQSIYHFRDADPGIFINRMHNAGEIGSDALQQKITLAENFRSHPGIIEAVNLLLLHEMRVDSQLSPYGNDDAMVAASARPEGDTQPSVHLFVSQLSTTKEEGADAESTDRSAQEDRNREIFVAQEIRRLYGTPIWDGKANRYRPLEYKDIAILARKWQFLDKTAETLRRCGLPVLVADRDPLFDRTESKVLIECLRWIDDPGQDTCLADVLHSDMVGLSAGEMAAIRQYSPLEPFFYQACLRYCREKDDGITVKLRAFFHLAEDWRRTAAEQPCHRLILRVLEETGYLHTVSGYTEGEERVEGLRKVAATARRIGESGSPSLYNFLCYADQTKGKTSDEKKKIPPDIEAIRLYTYHGSKGLEFPVVFLVYLDSMESSERKDVKALTLDGKMGAALMTNTAGKTMRNNLVLSSIIYYGKRFDFAENLRLLYVAMTRAKEKLYLVGKGVGKTEQSRFTGDINYYNMTTGNANNMRLLLMLACRMPGGEALAGNHSVGILPEHMQYPWKIQIQTEAMEEPEPLPVPAVLPETREQAAADAAPFLWRYPYGDEPSVPGTLAATALLQSIYPEQDEAVALKARPLQGYPKKKGDIRATDIGTWIHAVMEYMRPGMRAEKVLAELTEKGTLPPEAGDTVNCAAINCIMEDPAMAAAAASPHTLREQSFILRIPACEADPVRFAGCRTPVIVQGIIDLAYETEKGWVLLDYKSNRAETPEDMAHLVQYYMPQMRIYRRALESITKKPVAETGLVLISAGKILRFTLPEQS